MRISSVLFGLLVSVSACGGSDDESDDGNGDSGSGGSGNVVGGSNGTGGHSTATGGRSSSSTLSTGGSSQGGTSQSGPSKTVVPGQPCTGTCPTGSVESCSGHFCPYGTCGAPWDTYRCNAFYPEPVGASTVYCAAGSTGGYCLVTNQTSTQDYWAVNCNGGTPVIAECDTGCSVDANDVASCL
ncbi:MAG: hypothetical protein QM784_09990 [Polyangiaceae bacterium]